MIHASELSIDPYIPLQDAGAKVDYQIYDSIGIVSYNLCCSLSSKMLSGVCWII